MEVLHITLQSIEQDWIELRYWQEWEAEYEEKQLQISEIEDLITLCKRDYYALRPQLPTIGKKLYRWLDGEGRWLTRAIADCTQEGIVLAIAPTERLAHLPWEVLHDGSEFLVEKSFPLVAPVRWVNKETNVSPPQPRSLQMMFMATSPSYVQPVLDFEREESEILRITNTLPLTLRVEESGCVDELKTRWSRYKQDTFDIFHLTGHANIGQEEPYEPYFITETLLGEQCKTSPDELTRAFVPRRPRLVFLSGCRTGESGNNGSVPSFAETLIEQGIPAVLGWGRPVRDTTATKCAATLYERLAAGDEIAQALSLTFQALIQDETVKDWHLLRLYVRGESWGALVDAPEFYIPPEPVQQQFLDTAGLVRVATPEQYVGRRRLLQRALRSLRSPSKFGLMLQGMGGLGKSSTAARILERSPDYEPIVFYRGIDAAKLERTLNQQCLSEPGREILNSSLPLMQKLTKFFDDGLNKPTQRFMFVLDDFEANLDISSGDQAVLKPKVVDCLNNLLQALQQCRAPHRLLITSRYDVKFPVCNESIERIPLTSLKDADLRKKCDRLDGFRKDAQASEVQQQAIKLSDGNPRLLEWLNLVLLDDSTDSVSIFSSLEDMSAEFRENILAEQLLKQQSDEVITLLTRMQIFELPVPYEAIAAVCPELANLSDHCQKSVALGLLEWDGVENSNYRLPRILIPQLKEVTDSSIYNQGIEVLYEHWWKQSNVNEEQALELIRFAALAENHEIEDQVASSVGSACREQGRYRDAIEIWERILKQRYKLLGPEHLDVANSLSILASIYCNQGRYEESESLHRQGLEMKQKLLGSEHLDVANNLNNLALLYSKQGRYEEAKRFFRQALEMKQRLLGNEHLDVVICLNNLASIYRSQGRYEEAESSYKQALAISKKLLGHDHLDVANNLNNLAVLYMNQGRYEGAEPFFIQALEMLQKLLGHKHPHVAVCLNNLATICCNQGRYEEAEPLYKQALEIRQMLLGSEHPDVAQSLNNLAVLYENQGRHEKAEPLYRRVLEMCQQLLGHEHPDVASSLNNLAELYRNQERHKEAELLHKQALEMRQRLLGSEHPDVATSLNNLALLYNEQGRYEEAESYYLLAVSILLPRLGNNHPYTKALLNNFIQSLMESLQAGQSDRLSDHPFTQEILKQLRSQS